MIDLEPLFSLFEQNANPELAQQMEKYMAFQFEFFGIQKPLRRKLQNLFWKKYGYPAEQELESVVRQLWDYPKREAQYAALDLMERFVDKLPSGFVNTAEELITTKSWWDSVDLLATKIVYGLFEKYPDLETTFFDTWLKSGNIWLQRTVLIYQLKRKQNINTDLLEQAVDYLSGSEEFFIQKAIGWILRELSKYRPDYVRRFVRSRQLPRLSRREALRYLNRKQ